MNKKRARRVRKIVVWVVIAVVVIPMLYFLFEYINSNILSPTIG